MVLNAAFFGYQLGVWQGGLNGVNGLTDMGIQGFNSSKNLGLYGLGLQSLPDLNQWDFSRGVITHEAGEEGTWSDTHWWSKFLVAEGVVELATGGLGSLATKIRLVPRGIGFAPGTAYTAIAGMKNSGGHAIRYLIKDGTIANKGSLASKVDAFADIAKPILENPLKSFNGWVGADKARIFIGEVNVKKLAIFVATEGPFQGKVITSFFPNAKKLADWGF